MHTLKHRKTGRATDNRSWKRTNKEN